MSTATLQREFCMNPYYIDGKQVQDIHFFNSGGIVASVGRGWLSAFGGNNSGCDALEVLEYVRKIKPAFNVDFSYYTGKAGEAQLYINVNQLDGFTDLGEQIAREFDTETNYGHFIQFEWGAPEDIERGYEWAKRAARRTMCGCYTRSVPTDFGAACNRIAAMFKALGLDKVRGYSLEKMQQSDKALFDALNNLAIERGL